MINSSTYVNYTDDLQYTALHWACQEGSLSVAKWLLEKRFADPNLPDLYKITPLHLAVDRKHTDIVWLLLHHEANVNALDTWGQTPMDHARNFYHEAVEPILRKYGGKLASEL